MLTYIYAVIYRIWSLAEQTQILHMLDPACVLYEPGGQTTQISDLLSTATLPVLKCVCVCVRVVRSDTDLKYACQQKELYPVSPEKILRISIQLSITAP